MYVNDMTLLLEEFDEYSLAIVNKKVALDNATRISLNRQLAQ